MNEEYEVMETEETEVYEGSKDYSGLIGAGVIAGGSVLVYEGGKFVTKKFIIPGAKKVKKLIPFLNKKEEPDAEAPEETEVEVVEEK